MNLAFKYDEIDSESAIRLTKMIIQLFAHWELTYFEQSAMLGLSVKTNTSIARFKNGSSCIRMDRDTYDRVRFLLSIHQSLRQIFPLNPDLAYKWPKSSNQQFKGKTPIQVIIEDGILGLSCVHTYLESYKAN